MRSLGVFCILFLSTLLHAQSINTEFGKNRVQFTDDFSKWDRYETENFVTYWYGKGRNLAKTVVQYAELNHDDIQDVMEHRMNDKIQIIVYLDATDFKQSNIGNEEIFGSITGTTKIVGNKMFVYFDGDHSHLQQQIREGIARVYLNAILFGSSIQEIVQNAVLLKLPTWYKEGVIKYAARAWDHEVDDELRDLWLQKSKYHSFEKLADDHPRIAGHSMWYYIDQNYGRISISNLLYLTRISSNLDNSFEYVLNIDYEDLKRDWADYWDDYYDKDDGLYDESTHTTIDLKNKSYVPISHLRYSDDGSNLLYVYNNIGKYRLMLRDTRTGKEQTVMKYGHRNALQVTDYNYPCITWHEDGESFTVVYEHRDERYIRKYSIGDNLSYEEDILPEQIRRVYHIDHLNGHQYIMSASLEGYSDLIQYDALLRVPTAITADMHDDLYPQVIDYQGSRSILFASNRPDNWDLPVDIDTLVPSGDLDAYIYDLTTTEITKLWDNETDIHQPYMIDDYKISYLSAESGMNNIYLYDINRQFHTPLTNLHRNVINYTINDERKALIHFYHLGAYEIYEYELNFNNNIDLPTTPFYKSIEIQEVEEETPLIFIDREDDIIQQGFLFQSPFGDPENVPDIIEQKDNDPFNLYNDSEELTDKELVEWNSARVVAGRLKFRVDNFTTKLDNSVLFEGLENYNDPGDGIDLAALGVEAPANQLEYTPTGVLLQATIKDLFEDDVLVGGMRVPTTFNGSEFFLIYEDRKDLIDKKYSLYRRSYTDTYENNTSSIYKTKNQIILGEYQLKYPFDIYRSIRLKTSLRLDRYLLQATDNESLDDPVSTKKRLGLKLEYVYDNTINISTNIKNGTRYKIYTEALNRFDLQVVDGWDFSLSEGFTTIVGYDFRHYIPLLRHSVFALRSAGASSFGSEKILYYLGGMEGWLFQKFDQSTPIPTDESFAFRTGAFQMRGFQSNVRNGASYALANAELRIPIFKYLLGPNRGSSFIKDIQLTGFFDIGTAWHGSSPWSEDNPLNIVTVSSGNVITLNVKYFRNPLVMGYGVGARTTLLGYLLKFDYGWGLENGLVQDPRFYFTIGADF